MLPTVEIGGASILSLLIADPAYTQNDLRQDLWRAGHAHAGVWLVLSLVALRYVDEATLSESMRWVVRLALPAAALLMPLAFFLSVLSPEATEPNGMIYLAYVAGIVLAVGLLVLEVGLIRGRRTPRLPASVQEPGPAPRRLRRRLGGRALHSQRRPHPFEAHAREQGDVGTPTREFP